MNQYPSLPARFVPELEALRGVAALLVALHHSLATTATTPIFEKCIIHFLSTGRPAVTMFFVLSGFVLGESLRRQQGRLSEYLVTFSIRRIFRIYPAFLITTLLVAPLFFGESTRIWFSADSPDPHPLYTLARNLLFMEASINMVTWTLKIELIASLLLPFFHSFTLNFKTCGKELLLGGLIFLAIFPMGLGRWPCFLLMFYAGYLVPLGHSWIQAYWKARSFGQVALLGFAFLVWIGIHVMNSSETLIEARSLANRMSLLAETSACVVIIASLAYSSQTRLHAFLNLPLPRFLGSISFSFYLVHYPVLLVMNNLFMNPLIGSEIGGSALARGLFAWAITSALASGIAWVLFHYVEKSGVILGRRLTPAGR